MDILKKFRYNFNYWLKNCYQQEENESHRKVFKKSKMNEAYSDDFDYQE